MRAADSSPVRILLVNFNTYDQPYPIYPIGLTYIEGALREDGHLTEIWDAISPGESLEQAAGRFQPDFIGLTMRNIDNVQAHHPVSFTRDLLACVERLRAVSSAPLILGGSGFSIFPDELYARTGVEFGIVGAGETAIRRLIRSLRGGTEPLGEIAGLIFRNDHGTIVHVPRERRADGFSGSPHHEPARLSAYAQEGFPLGLQTQRGCPLHCCYCTYPLIEGTRSRFRTGEEVAAELACMEAAGVRQAFLVDSVFNTRNSHVIHVCEAVLRAGVKINWECLLRPDKTLTRELLELMQRAGLNHIEFGSDSFSDPVLRSYGKGFDFGEIQQASELASELKIRHTHFMIFGGPGETHESIEETIARAAEIPKALYFATIGMRIYPGTPLCQRVNLLHANSPDHAPSDFLLEPRFHIEPPLTVAGIHARLSQVLQGSGNWALGDLPPAFAAIVAKLRRSGKGANIWEYMELMQGLGRRPQASATGVSANPPSHQSS
jgi:radical SAM superfamily enzyme YgiQ (UPF0313 family)